MAFALTSFSAQIIRYAGPGRRQARQYLQFDLTAANTDVDCDIGDLSGTFWTAVGSDGGVGEQALEFITAQYPNWGTASNVFAPQIFGRVVAAAASGTAYARTLNATTGLPEFTFDAGNAPTALTVCVEMEVENDVFPRTLELNA